MDPPLQHRQKVLIVDGNPDDVRLLRELLEPTGVGLHIRTDAGSAIEAFHAIRPDLVLIDSQIPEASVADISREIRRTEHGRSLPIILLQFGSSAEDPPGPPGARDTDFSLVLPKPLDPLFVLEALRRLLPGAFLAPDAPAGEAPSETGSSASPSRSANGLEADSFEEEALGALLDRLFPPSDSGDVAGAFANPPCAAGSASGDLAADYGGETLPLTTTAAEILAQLGTTGPRKPSTGGEGTGSAAPADPDEPRSGVSRPLGDLTAASAEAAPSATQPRALELQPERISLESPARLPLMPLSEDPQPAGERPISVEPGRGGPVSTPLIAQAYAMARESGRRRRKQRRMVWSAATVAVVAGGAASIWFLRPRDTDLRPGVRAASPRSAMVARSGASSRVQARQAETETSTLREASSGRTALSSLAAPSFPPTAISAGADGHEGVSGTEAAQAPSSSSPIPQADERAEASRHRERGSQQSPRRPGVSAPLPEVRIPAGTPSERARSGELPRAPAEAASAPAPPEGSLSSEVTPNASSLKGDFVGPLQPIGGDPPGSEPLLPRESTELKRDPSSWDPRAASGGWIAASPAADPPGRPTVSIGRQRRAASHVLSAQVDGDDPLAFEEPLLPAIPVRRTMPAYPPLAIAHGQSGTVVLALKIDPKGRVAAVRVKQSAAPALDRAAAAAAHGWVYLPARHHGLSVASWIEEAIDFTLP